MKSLNKLSLAADSLNVDYSEACFRNFLLIGFPKFSSVFVLLGKCAYDYTPGIYANRYVVFSPSVRLIVCSFVCTSSR